MTPARRIAGGCALLIGSVLLTGCQTAPAARPALSAEPTMPELTIPAARDELARLGRGAEPLERPLLIFSGWGDPGVAGFVLVRALESAVLAGGEHPPIHGVDFFTTFTPAACRERALNAAARALGATPGQPVEVDIIGKSMGGLVAREVARHQASVDQPSLIVRRIFTISTPHRGARLAGLPTLDPRVVSMRSGSDFLVALDADLARPGAPPIHAYTRTGDWMVGEANTAPAGGTVAVLPRPWHEFGHIQAGGDPRIVADIVRRLRGDAPLLPDAGSVRSTPAMHGEAGEPRTFDPLGG
ncbi:MAG: hypothetical protein AB8G96_17550 [Phycisphaerales bacterium]